MLLFESKDLQLKRLEGQLLRSL